VPSFASASARSASFTFSSKYTFASKEFLIPVAHSAKNFSQGNSIPSLRSFLAGALIIP